VWGDVYFFTELNLATRESGDLDLRVGELYLDFEDVSKLWGHDRQLNVRAGRFDIPFGEEYLARDAIDNPLISHSLVDLWGVDEGIELTVRWENSATSPRCKMAVFPGTRDFNADKSVVGRLSYDPTRWLHLRRERDADRRPGRAERLQLGIVVRRRMVPLDRFAGYYGVPRQSPAG
jgi:hypothetical protein